MSMWKNLNESDLRQYIASSDSSDEEEEDNDNNSEDEDDRNGKLSVVTTGKAINKKTNINNKNKASSASTSTLGVTDKIKSTKNDK